MRVGGAVGVAGLGLNAASLHLQKRQPRREVELPLAAAAEQGPACLVEQPVEPLVIAEPDPQHERGAPNKREMGGPGLERLGIATRRHEAFDPHRTVRDRVGKAREVWRRRDHARLGMGRTSGEQHQGGEDAPAAQPAYRAVHRLFGTVQWTSLSPLRCGAMRQSIATLASA